MHERTIKDYYKNTYNEQAINIKSNVIDTIRESKFNDKKPFYRLKYILLVTFIMSLILGCAVIFRSEFLGPDGELTWILSSRNQSSDEYEKVNKIFKELELEEGEAVGIYLNDSDKILYRQVPLRVTSLMDINKIDQSLEFNYPESINNNSFDYALYYNKSASVMVDIDTNFDGFVEFEDYKLKLDGIEPISSHLVLSYGVGDKSIELSVDPSKPVISGEDEIIDVMVEVAYSNTEELKNHEVINIDGFQGALIAFNNTLRYHILYEGLFISIFDNTGTLELEEFEAIVRNIAGQ